MPPCLRASVVILLAAISIATLGVESRALAQSAAPAPESFAIGDWSFSPSLQLRTRGEYRRDPVDMGLRTAEGTVRRVDDAALVFERTRLGLGADRGPLHAQITLQDSHAWGSSPAGEGGYFRPFEAYAEARTSSARPTFLRIGRQAISWGDGRLLGSADWHPVARSLDAVRGHAALGTFDVEAIAAMLAQPQPASPTFGQSDFLGTSTGTQLYGLQIGWSLDPLLRVELSGLARIARTVPSGSSFDVARLYGETYTGDLRVFGEGRGFKYAIEGAYQFGTTRELGRDRAAYAAAAYVGRTFDNVVFTPTLRIGASFASGDDGTGKYKQFDPLLPDVYTNHGAMDIFAWSNAAELHARLALVPWTDGVLGFEYRYARLVEASGEWITTPLATIGRAQTNEAAELGHEGDFFLSWLPWTSLELRAGYSAFLLGDGARTIRAAAYSPAAVSHFGYAQATLTIP